MYTGTLTLCAVIALLGGLGLVMELVLNRLVFEPMEEDNEEWED
jgi:hypothetical protein